jgi:hypothetical protein
VVFNHKPRFVPKSNQLPIVLGMNEHHRQRELKQIKHHTDNTMQSRQMSSQRNKTINLKLMLMRLFHTQMMRFNKYQNEGRAILEYIRFLLV